MALTTLKLPQASTPVYPARDWNARSRRVPITMDEENGNYGPGLVVREMSSNHAVTSRESLAPKPFIVPLASQDPSIALLKEQRPFLPACEAAQQRPSISWGGDVGWKLSSQNINARLPV